jgi:hypothetical protein
MIHGFASDASVATVAAEPKGPPKLAGTARKRPCAPWASAPHLRPNPVGGSRGNRLAGRYSCRMARAAVAPCVREGYGRGSDPEGESINKT